MIVTRILYYEKYLNVLVAVVVLTFAFLVSPLALFFLWCFPRVSRLLIFASSESLVSFCNPFSILSFSFSLLFLSFFLLYIFSKVISFSWFSGLCILLFLSFYWVYSASPLKMNSIPLLFLPLIVSRIPYPHASFWSFLCMPRCLKRIQTTCLVQSSLMGSNEPIRNHDEPLGMSSRSSSKEPRVRNLTIPKM